MSKNDSSSYVSEEFPEIDFLSLLHKIFADWKTLTIWCIVSAVIGLIVAISLPKEYQAMSKVAPESVSSTNSGSYAALASMAGFNISGSSSSDAISPSIYPEVVSSNPFAIEMFSVPVTYKEKGEDKTIDLYEFYGLHTQYPWWKMLRSFPSTIIKSIFNSRGNSKNQKVLKGYSDIDINNLSGEQLGIIGLIKSSIVVDKDKKTGLISVIVVAQDPLVASSLNCAVVSKLQEYVTRYRTEKARKDLDYYLMLYEQAQQHYLDSQQKYAKYVDSNQGAVLQRVRIEQERLQNESQLAYQIYSQCALQVQSGKAKLQQETPVFTVLEPASIPLKTCNKPLAFYILFFTFLGFIFASLWILWGRSAVLSFRKSTTVSIE